MTAFNAVIDAVNTIPEPKDYDEEIKSLLSGVDEAKAAAKIEAGAREADNKFLSAAIDNFKIDVDDYLDFELKSQNPVENKVIADEFSRKQDLIVDTFTGIGEMWGAAIDEKDSIIAVGSESGKYLGAFDIQANTFMKTWLPPLRDNRYTWSNRDMAVCYSRRAKKYVFVERHSVENAAYGNGVYLAVKTSDDAKQWRETWRHYLSFYMSKPAGASCVNYVTKVIYDEDTGMTLFVKGQALVCSFDCKDWTVVAMPTMTRSSGIASLGGGKFVTWSEGNEGIGEKLGVTLITYADGKFSFDFTEYSDELSAEIKATGVFHPFGCEAIGGCAYVGFDTQGGTNDLLKFDPSTKEVTVLLKSNRIRCSCKTEDAIYMFAKGKTVYKISKGGEVITLESSSTGVTEVIQGAV